VKSDNPFLAGLGKSPDDQLLAIAITRGITKDQAWSDLLEEAGSLKKAAKLRRSYFEVIKYVNEQNLLEAKMSGSGHSGSGVIQARNLAYSIVIVLAILAFLFLL
jgi:hypothetical protein